MIRSSLTGRAVRVLRALALLALPLIVLPLVTYGRRVRSLSRLAQDTLASSAAFAQERSVGFKPGRIGCTQQQLAVKRVDQLGSVPLRQPVPAEDAPALAP